MCTVAVANQKGGVGKSTTALNLGASLTARGKRVLIVDLDPQASATLSLLGPEAGNIEHSTYDVITKKVKASQAIVRPSSVALDLIPSSIALAAAEQELISKVGREHYLAEAIKGAIKNYDFTIIDCPPSLGLLTINALFAADEALLPCQATFLSVAGLGLFWGIAEEVRRLHPALKIEGILPTFTNSRELQSQESLQQLSEEFGDLVYKSVIRRNAATGRAAGFGVPVVVKDPSATGAVDYLAFTEEFLARHEGSL